MKKPVHASQTQFATKDGCLQIGGIALPRLAQRIGSSPFFAYDRDLLTARVQHLRQSLPKDIYLHYSIKANPMPAVVQHMAGLVDGLDVASAGELKCALDTSTSPGNISFAGPGKTDAELSQALASGAMIILESEGELERLHQLAQRLTIQAKVMIRVNPDFELKSSGMRMGGGAKQFGIDAEQVPQVLQRIAALNIDCVDWFGFHIFSGSQSLKADAIMEAQTKSIELAIALAQHASKPLRHLNLGGGFGIPYFPGELPLDIAPIGVHLVSCMERIRSVFPDIRVALEFGRYLVGEAGIYVAKVIDRKLSRGKIFLVIDGGLNHHLAASGNFGQVIRKNYPVTTVNFSPSTIVETVSVVGPLCTPLDLIADEMMLPQTQIGDYIVVFQSGAYGLSASPYDFLGHPKAIEVLV
ncbi:diaminopimelate decarboxylase [Undibacterium sp. GrIS 1.2]|uniref:pyridoxal-dependent decarboxylase, exosortase A system-associated n=1 Tax=Undibacterium sp. GrIS 1.2 TaxID=3143933 RepID=UPI0033999C46